MITDILKKYMNVFIIILYVYILYSYDFKDNTQLLLVITGIFIYIIYKNKGNAFTNDIIEGNRNEGGGDAAAAAAASAAAAAAAAAGGGGGGGDGGGGDGAGGDGAGGDGAGGDGAGGDGSNQLYVADGGNDGSRRRLLELLNEVRSELESMDENTVDRNDPRVDELLRLYVEVYPNVEVNLPNILSGADNLPIPEIDLENVPLNLDLNALESINIPSDLTNNYNETELPKLKKRIKYLEEKVKELDDEDNEQMLKEKIMELEIENDKWNQMGEESKEGDKNLKERKVRSFSNYKTTTPMGMYDGMCLDHLKKENIYDLANGDDVNTFLGTSLPLKLKTPDNSKLNGPSVDGNDSSSKRLNMFETNKTSISCCEDSPYLSSNGCVCLTSDQEDYLINRGGNHD